MRTRLFGTTGLRVSELFLGTMAFGTAPDDPEVMAGYRRILDAYAEAGGNTLDTANFYQDGRSEAAVGELLKGQRDEFVLATKYTGPRVGRTGRTPGDPNSSGSHRKNLRLSLEESLRRLRTDHIDVYWVHVWDRHTPVEETMRALDDAVTAGKVLYVGISDAPAWIVAHANTLADWRGWTPFAGIQAPYSLLRRDAERELLRLAERFGLTLAAWGPLAQGALAGARTPKDARERGIQQTLTEVADGLGVTPAQAALAWLRARSHAVHPILGAASESELADSLGTLTVDLPDEARHRLDTASALAPGFPTDFIDAVAPDVFPEDHARLDPRAA